MRSNENYEPGYGDLIAGSVRLLACGALVGVLGYFTWVVVRRRLTHKRRWGVTAG
jgi:hypothetical protein